MRHHCFNISFILFFLPLIRVEVSPEGVGCCDGNVTCVQETIQNLLGKLKSGIRVDDHELSINPLRSDIPFVLHIKVSILNYQQESTNSYIDGLGDSVVSDSRLSSSGPNDVITFTTRTPHFKHKLNYRLIGSVGQLAGIFDENITLNETGLLTFSVDDLEFHHTVTLRRRDSQEREAIRVQSYEAHMKNLHSPHLDYTNLFGGSDSHTADIFIWFENAILGEILQVVIPELDDVYSKIFTEVTQQVLNTIPENEFCSKKN